MNHTLIHGDCLEVVKGMQYDCIFVDPPDNIGLGYPGYDDNKPEGIYLNWLSECLLAFLDAAPIVWMSYNAKWTFKLGEDISWLDTHFDIFEVKPCVQVFTFGQYNSHDMGNCHRPLVRLRRNILGTDCLAPIYSDQIRVPSWRQLNGDKRANPKGKIPGDVFNFPRVVGNSKQRRSFCPTQLNEGLVERCILQSTREGGTVLDPFAGTGTTLRVCERINRQCTLVEQSMGYCKEIAKEHGLNIRDH